MRASWPSRSTAEVTAVISGRPPPHSRPGPPDVAEDRVQDHHDCDHDRVDRPAVPTAQHPRDQRDDHGDEEQIDQRILKLSQDLAPDRYRRRRPQLIRTIRREAASRLAEDSPESRSTASASATSSTSSTEGSCRGAVSATPHCALSLGLARFTIRTRPRYPRAVEDLHLSVGKISSVS